MAVDLILHKQDGTTINLYNKDVANLSSVTRAEQRQGLNADDIVNITVESAAKINFNIGDRLNVFSRWYKINRLPTMYKTGNRLFTYNLELEGVQYDLARATYDLNINTTNNELQDVQADTLTGNLHRFATVLISNANRVFPNKWKLGVVPTGTEDKTLMFGEQDNCLSVLQILCTEYNIEFEITQSGDINTINFKKAGQVFPYTFEYGKGKGLYGLERLNVSTSNITTRLKVYGGTKNITSKYRANRLCLAGKTKGQSFIEKTDAVNRFGIWEATKFFDDIYPKRTGKVTSITSGNVLKFSDSTMNFDLNEKEADGITTKYLLAGVSAKIHFNSGNLSGYEFELQSYDHATKTFTIKPFKDERDDTFPSEKSKAFQFDVNDEYVILDIALPQAYIDDAESLLASEADTYYNQNSQPKVQYSLSVAEDFLQSLSGVGSTSNIFSVGDYIPIKDADIEVDKSVRIQSFTRDLLSEYKYQLTISDTANTSITNKVISDLIDIDKIIKINDLKDPARARRDWRSAQELLGMIFDTEGDYYTEKIKPNSIETSMLAVGAKSTQFGLANTVIQANYNANPNSVNIKGGVLSHYAIEDNVRIWNLADSTVTLSSNSAACYIYAKCQKIGNAGSIILTTSQIKVDQLEDSYHFMIGVVNSVDADLNARSVALTYGFTTVNGRFIRTGRIQSNDGKTYFDLDLGEIGGKITFKSNGNDTDLSDWSNSITGDISDAQQKALDAERKALQAIQDAENAVSDYNAKFALQQQQIDGQVSNWFYPYSPTLSNYPASTWATNLEKDRHIGDTFTNTQQIPLLDAGKSWRFVKNGSVYEWTQISDSDALLALQKASEAQSTADGKSTTFVAQPHNYDVGDSWFLGADTEVNGKIYKQGEILTANQASVTYNQAHWLKRVRYTDDSAVNNLEIGGRNLISNIPNNWVKGYYNPQTGLPVFGGINHNSLKERIICEPNSYYTMSSPKRMVALQYDENDVYIPPIVNKVEGGALTFKTHTSARYLRFYILLVGEPNELNLIGEYKLKIEKGTKPTDWSPAPEDVQADIDSAKQDASTAQSTANTARNEVGNLNSYVDGAFKDGVISEAEAKAIEKYKNTINEAMAKAEASFAKVFANTYLEGTAKTALENAKINLWGQRDTLLSTINNAIADGKTTVAEKNAVDSAFNTFNNLMSAFQSALEEANKAIQKRLDDISKESLPKSIYNYAAGCLVKTDVPANLSAMFTVKIGGNAYRGGFSAGQNNINTQLNFYSYNDSSIINSAGTHHGYDIGEIKVFIYQGFVCLWFKQKTDFQSFEITALNTISSTPTKNRVTSIQNVAMPEEGVERLITITPIRTANQNDVNALNSSIASANNSVTSLNQYVDGAFKDGVIDSAEATTIAQLIKTVESERDMMLATYDKLFLNSYLEGTAKTSLQQNKITFVGAVNDVITAINTAIADNKITPTERTNVNNKFNAYKTALADFSTAIENANKAIQDKLKGYSDTAQSSADNAQADANNANAKLSDIASDNKLTPSEKQETKKEWDAIDAEYPINTAQANRVNAPTTAYTTAYNALNSYITPLLSDLSTTSDIIGSVFRSRFVAYYVARTDLLNDIAIKIKDRADNAQTKADQAQLDAANAKDTANNALGNVSSLNTYIDGAFKDGVIDNAEAKAIEKYLNSLNETKLSVDSSYSKLFNNEYLEGVAKTNLSTSKDALNIAYTNLINSINAVVAWTPNQLIISSVVQPSAVSVVQGNVPTLPSAITLNISDGSTRTANVTWSTYNTDIVGNQTLTGSYNLPSGIVGGKPNVSLTLNVTAKPLTILGVVQPNSITVQKNGSVTMPTTITINISDGTTRSVSVTWGSYSTATEGTFNINGTYNLPSGITGSKPTVTQILNVIAQAQLTVTSVVQPSSVSVVQGGTAILPTNVVLNISDGSTRTVSVTWSSHNTSTVGTQTLTGTYNLPSGITGSKPGVSLTLTVTAQVLTVTSVVQPAGVSVVQNGTPTLPATVTLNISDGSTRDVAVTWGSYSTANVGTLNIAGSYNLPSGVTGSKPAVSIQLTVTASGTGANVVDFIPIMTARTDLFTTGSDGGGSYVQPKASALDWNMFNSKISEIIPNTSKMYVRYVWGYDGVSTNVRVRKDGSFGVFNLQMGSGNTKVSAVITDSGVDQFGMYLGGNTIKIYNLELRNDGLTPSWYNG